MAERIDSREGFTFQEEREYSDRLDYEQECADNLLENEDDDDDDGPLDDIDTWSEYEWEQDNLCDFYDGSYDDTP
jgi:hypothetical protein